MIDAAVITASARASMAGVSGMAAVPLLRRAGASRSGGTTQMKTRPSTRHAMPGTANAARQPSHLISSPVSSADTAMPRLPARPFKPMVAPGRCACCTSIGMPTGW